MKIALSGATACIAGVTLCVALLLFGAWLCNNPNEDPIRDHHGQYLEVLRVSKNYPIAVQLSSGDVVYAPVFKDEDVVNIIEPGDTVSVDSQGYLALRPRP
jgi:hypothetical protein